MKKVQILVMLGCILGAAYAIAAQSCPRGATPQCNCPNSTVPVTCYGAVPDDGGGDSAAIQQAINRVPDGWTVFFPAGVYVIDQGLYMERSNINLLGEGIQSELKTPQRTSLEPFTVLSMPRNETYQFGCVPVPPSAPPGTYVYNNTPRNITIEKLAFNGDFNQPDGCPVTEDCGPLNGIWILQGEDITIRDVLLKQFSREGITIALGSVIPKNILLQRIRTQSIRRTAVYFGLGENLRLEDSSLEDEGSGWPEHSSVAIDVEVEGGDVECHFGGVLPEHIHGGYVYNSTIKNTLIISPTSEESRGGVNFTPAQGPIRKALFQGNVVVNSTGVTTAGYPYPADPPYDDVRDPRVGDSRLIRELDISQNWISNLHTSAVYPWGNMSVQFEYTGYAPDAYGPNDVRFNDNTLTFFPNSDNYRNMRFSAVRNLSGTNNKTFRPYIVNTSGDPQAGSENFVWNKTVTSAAPTNMQITNTLDNGWPGSRLACDDPSHLPEWYFCSLTGKSNQLTWIDNGADTPTQPPIIRFADVWAERLVVNIEEPNRQPVRLMIYKNGIPEGLKTVPSSANTYISLSRKPIRGDFFELKAFNENGWFGDYSFLY